MLLTYDDEHNYTTLYKDVWPDGGVLGCLPYDNKELSRSNMIDIINRNIDWKNDIRFTGFSNIQVTLEMLGIAYATASK